MDNIKAQFPIFKAHPNLAYLDNAATTQKPQEVLKAMNDFYTNDNANIHRGVYALSQKATDAYEEARAKVAKFINAEPRQIIFTRGTTEAINLVASSFGQSLNPGDEILITEMEHHANIVPWQLVCQRTGAKLRSVPMNDLGELVWSDDLLTDRTKLLAVVHVSNSLGTINPIKRIIADAHRRGIPVLVDGAQAIAHLNVDVQDLDADFYAFSGHKMYGPTGIGVLYGQNLDALPPYHGGGDMIESVTLEKSTFRKAPQKFEAGTPPIAEAICLGAAVDFMNQIDFEHEQELLAYATDQLQQIDGIRLIGTAHRKAPIISFVLNGVHPHDIGTILDQEGVAIRTGHHCTQPVIDHFGVPATSRISVGAYNTKDDIDRAIAGIKKCREIFA